MLIYQVCDLQYGLSDDDIDFFFLKDSYCICWDVVVFDSGILKSEVFVCFEFDFNDCLLCNLDVGNQIFICMVDLDLKGGIKYLIKIKVVNFFGVFVEVFLDGFVLDFIFFLMGEVFFVEMFKLIIEGDIKYYICFVIVVQWRGFWDKESGVCILYVCFGIILGKCNIRNFIMVYNIIVYIFVDVFLV